MQKYSITNLTEKQLWIIQSALEAYSRIKCGQFREFQRLLDEFTFTDDVDKNIGNEIEKRLNEIKYRVFGYQPNESTGIAETKSISAKRAYEMYYLIRQFFDRRNPDASVSVYRYDLRKVTDDENIQVVQNK